MGKGLEVGKPMAKSVWGTKRSGLQSQRVLWSWGVNLGPHTHPPVPHS